MMFVIEGFFRCSPLPIVVCVPYGWLGKSFAIKAVNSFLPSLVKPHIVTLHIQLQALYGSHEWPYFGSGRLALSPKINLVAWYILHITSNIVRCIGVCSLTSDSCHELVVLVRNVVLCSYLRHRVNLVIPNLALCRVCHVAILFVKFLNLLQIRVFCLVVGSTNLYPFL